MPSKELSILLLAKDMASKTIGKVSGEVSRLGKVGALASRGVQNLAANLVKLGAVAAVGIGAAVHSGIESLAELEDATTAVDGALKATNQTGKVTSQQIAAWANEIEANVQAAFDDKAIVAGAASLLRYGKVSADTLQSTMVVMTDLAARTGDVGSAAEKLGKALASPSKATRVLREVGVTLTKAEEKQIKAFEEAGRLGEAQAIILRKVADATRDAAAASKGPYNDALNTLGDVAEDTKRALAEGFLPVLEKIAGKLRKGLADQKTMDSIRAFGKTLAGSLDSLIGIAEKLPWGTIADSLRLAGAGARTILDAFTKMPPWVQTAIITGWGLNKLTGGALGGIIGELGKGLIKGVLGMNAAVVNITAGTVTGVGGGLPPAGAAAGAGAAAAAAGVGTVAGLAVLSALSAVQGNADLFGKYGLTQPEIRAVKYSRMSEEQKATSARYGYPRQTNQEALLASALAKLASSTEASAMETKRATAIQASAARAQALQQTFTNLQLRAIAAKDFSPKVTIPVYVTSTTNIRDQQVSTRVRASYGASPIRSGVAKPI